MAMRLEWAGAASGDATARFVFGDLTEAGGAEIDRDAAGRRGFSGTLGDAMLEEAADGLVLSVGLGTQDAVDDDALRVAGGAIARQAAHCESVVVPLDGLAAAGIDPAVAAERIGLGIALASYTFDRFRSDRSAHPLATARFVGGSRDVEAALGRAAAIADAVALARDLVNTPAGDLSPRDFADVATEVAGAAGVEVEIFDETRIADEQMGGLLGVAAGSTEPPRFVVLTYDPHIDRAPTVALVGKGITFDSGGLSLKTGAGMMTMKTDMSGAAAVLATLGACARLGVDVRVRGYIPLTENMPSGSATKPGDVLKTRSGQTIEVLNTDAEGRLVLADALFLAAEEHPDAIIDLATLTGACIVALGSRIAGLLGNDDRLIDQVRRAATAAGESVWPLPLPTGYHHHIESEIADMKNIGVNGQAGSISAALLLERFVGDVPWVHLDIAGPARSDEDRGLLRKGGTGFGVRTLLELLGSYEACGGAKEPGAVGISVLS